MKPSIQIVSLTGVPLGRIIAAPEVNYHWLMDSNNQQLAHWNATLWHRFTLNIGEDAILQTPDKRQAIVVLTGAALSQALDAIGGQDNVPVVIAPECPPLIRSRLMAEAVAARRSQLIMSNLQEIVEQFCAPIPA